MHDSRFVPKTARIVLLCLLMLLPVFFLPWTRDFYDTNKWMVFVFTALVVLMLWAGKILTTGTMRVAWSGTILGFGLMAGASFFSLTISSFNKIESLLSPMGPITWIAATIILFFGIPLCSLTHKTIIRLSLTILAGVVALMSIYQQLGLASMFFPIGSPYANPFFTPLGSPVSLLTFLILILPISISIAINSIKEKNDAIAGVSVVTSTVMIIGIGMTLWNFLTIAPSQILPLPDGVRFVASAWNTIPHALFGIGPEKFSEIFTLIRPQPFNMSPIWNIGFSANASLLLHIATTLGLVGVVCFLVLIAAIWHEWCVYPVTKIQAIIAICLACFAPPTLILLVCIVLLIFSSDQQHIIHTHAKRYGKYCLGIAVLLFSCASLYLLFRWYEGERLLYASIQTASSGNGSQTFILQEKSLKTNPMSPTYHMAISQTSLTLAESLAATFPRDADGALQPTDEEKTLLANLINRSIQEAKLAVTLAPTNVNTWLNLSRVYQGLVGIAKDADSWAIASYQKAMLYDPTNPVLHLDLGGLYMLLQKPEEAGQEYIRAITLKPNYITAWYNLANAFRQLADWDNAVKTLEQTKLLIAKGSTDETTIEQEIISTLQEKKTKGASTKPNSLTIPQFALPTNL